MAAALTTDLRRELSQAAYVGLEVVWLGGLLWLLEQGQAPVRAASLGWVAVLYPVLYLPLRLGRIRGWIATGREEGIGAGLTLLLGLGAAWSGLLDQPAGTLLPALPGTKELWFRLSLIIGGGLFCALRGWLVSRRSLTFRGIGIGFQVGLGMLGLVIGLAAATGLPLPARLVPAFFGFGLTALWLGRARSGSGSTGPAAILGPLLWMGLILLGGGLLMAFLNREIMALVIDPLLALAKMIVEWLKYLISLIPADHGLIELPPPREKMPGGIPGQNRLPFWLDLGWLREPIEVITLILWAILFGAALTRFLHDLLRRLGRRLGAAPGLTIKRVETGLWTDLKDLLRLIWWLLVRLVRFFRRKPPAPPRITPEAADLRQIYAHLLRWAAKRGLPREPGKTPAELLPALVRMLPERAEELNFITESYNLARYGPDFNDRARLGRAKECWTRVKRTRPGPARPRRVLTPIEEKN